MLRLCTSNHTLSLMTKDLSNWSGLMCFCKAFCASDLVLINCLRCSCAVGTESSGVLIDAVGFMPMISSCGMCFVCSCFHELCANSTIGRRVLQFFCHPMTN